jgi:hypothetical protein
MARDFYLVQRIQRSWHADHKPSENASPLMKVRNLFGNGTLGDYDLEYMGSAEFEFGAIPEALKRLKDAGKNGLILREWEYGGHVLDFLYRHKDGEPFEAWANWAEGNKHDPPFYGKETPFELRDRLAGKEPPSWARGEWRTHVYWALNANVMWAFHEAGHLPRMLASMGQKEKANAA